MSKETGLVPSTVDRAIAKTEEKKENRMSVGTSAQRSEITKKIVTNSVDNLLSSLTRPSCAKNDLNEIRSRTIQYLEGCAEAQCVPLIEDWAVALGICRATLYRWFDNPGTPEIGDFLERVRTSIFGMNAQAAYQNAINNIGWIFYAKNSLGMSDKSEVTLSTSYDSEAYRREHSIEHLREKYLEAGHSLIYSIPEESSDGSNE